jgi:hypothetical protein
LVYVLTGYPEPFHEELSDYADVIPLNQHFKALSTVTGFMYSGCSGAFHAKNGHDLFKGDLPNLQAGNNGHFFVRLSLGFD